MRIKHIQANELTSSDTANWTRVQRSNKFLSSPFYSPEFTRIVNEQWRNVEVAIIYGDDGRQIGFFPFERHGAAAARPVGDMLNDFHGLVAAPSIGFNPRQLLEACGLRSIFFDHMPASQSCFQPHATVAAKSPYIDVSQGFQHYRRQRRVAGSKAIEGILRKLRKAEREIGPLRLEKHTSDPSVLDLLIVWKSEKNRDNGNASIVDVPWFRPLAEKVLATQTAGFEGMLSILYAGDQPLAVHLGLRSESVLHWWVPAYDRNFGKYSPGLGILIMLAKEMSDDIDRIDLGKGTSEFKLSLKSGDITITEGIIDQRLWNTVLQRSWLHLRDRVRSSDVLRQPALRLDRALTQGRLWLGFDR